MLPSEPPDLAVRIELAEIKGMLTRALSDNDRRLNEHGLQLLGHTDTLTKQGATQAEQGAMLETLDRRTSGAGSRAATVIALVVSGGGLILSIATRLAWT